MNMNIENFIKENKSDFINIEIEYNNFYFKNHYRMNVKLDNYYTYNQHITEFKKLLKKVEKETNSFIIKIGYGDKTFYNKYLDENFMQFTIINGNYTLYIVSLDKIENYNKAEFLEVVEYFMKQSTLKEGEV